MLLTATGGPAPAPAETPEHDEPLVLPPTGPCIIAFRSKASGDIVGYHAYRERGPKPREQAHPFRSTKDAGPTKWTIAAIFGDLFNVELEQL